MFGTVLGLSSASLGPFWGSRMRRRRQLRAVESHLGAFDDRPQARKASNSQRERHRPGSKRLSARPRWLCPCVVLRSAMGFPWWRSNGPAYLTDLNRVLCAFFVSVAGRGSMLCFIIAAGLRIGLGMPRIASQHYDGHLVSLADSTTFVSS